MRQRMDGRLSARLHVSLNFDRFPKTLHKWCEHVIAENMSGRPLKWKSITGPELSRRCIPVTIGFHVRQKFIAVMNVRPSGRENLEYEIPSPEGKSKKFNVLARLFSSHIGALKNSTRSVHTRERGNPHLHAVRYLPRLPKSAA